MHKCILDQDPMGGQTRNEKIPWNLMSHCGLVIAFKRLQEVDLAGLMSKLEQSFLKVCVCVCMSVHLEARR